VATGEGVEIQIMEVGNSIEEKTFYLDGCRKQNTNVASIAG
jgi:hypothetical protein